MSSVSDFSAPSPGAASMAANAVDFDELKFLALRRFVGKLEDSSADEDVEELQLDFLERCDAVLLKTVSRFVGEEGRLNRLAADVDSESDWRNFEAFDVEPASILEEDLESCLHCLEEMEDVATSWMAVVFFEVGRLNRLYEALLHLQESGPSSALHMSEDVREQICALVVRSPLLFEEEALRFRLNVQHLGDRGLIHLLYRFLCVHLDYARALQEQCFVDYPELKKKVRARLLREASLQAKRLM